MRLSSKKTRADFQHMTDAELEKLEKATVALGHRAAAKIAQKPPRVYTRPIAVYPWANEFRNLFDEMVGIPLSEVKAKMAALLDFIWAEQYRRYKEAKKK